MTIFKAYDIRGLVPEQLDAEDAYRIGRASACFFGQGELCVGYDARESSPELREALVRGITEGGLSVVDLGLISTPMLYHAVSRLRTAGGIMVTASHNPAGYNGFKICADNAKPVGEATGLRDIETLCENLPEPAKVAGSLRSENVAGSYASQSLAMGSAPKQLKVVVDAGNGMAAAGLEPVIQALDLDVVKLYYEPDGRFPNHPADPLNPDNLVDLQRTVREEKADVGVAFDGDADRAVFVDDEGEVVSSDLVTALLARSQLARRPGGKVLYDLRSSWVTAEEIERAGGVAEMCRVGHSFVKAHMRESGAIFAGELSGHYYFRFDNELIADDAVAAFVGLLEVVGQASSFAELVAPLRRYAASGELNREIPDPKAFIAGVEAEHREAREVSHLDGLLVRYDDWWFNLRPSNTEPVVRLNLEAKSREKMELERDRILALMEGAAQR